MKQKMILHIYFSQYANANFNSKMGMQSVVDVGHLKIDRHIVIFISNQSYCRLLAEQCRSEQQPHNHLYLNTIIQS